MHEAESKTGLAYLLEKAQYEDGNTQAVTDYLTEDPEMAAYLSGHTMHECGILYLDDAWKQIVNKRKEKYVKGVHTHTIAQGTGKDTRWKTYIHDEESPQNRKRVVKKTYEEMINFLYDLYRCEAERKKTTVRSLFPRWLNRMRDQLHPESYIKRLQSFWNSFYEEDPIVDVPVEKLTKAMMEDWAYKLIRENKIVSKTKYYNVTTIMRQILRFAVDTLEVLEYSPFERVQINSRRIFRGDTKKKSETQVFRDEEVARIEKLCFDMVGKRKNKYPLAPLAALFQFHTGLRIGEVCAVRYDDIDRIQKGYLHVRSMVERDANVVRDYTKTAEGIRDVPLTPKALKIIRKAKAYQLEHGTQTEFIFSASEKHVSPWAIDNVFRKLSRELGGAMRSSHKARKTYISCLIDNGVNLDTVREYAGHRDERTTLNNYLYDRSSEKERLAKVEKALSYGNA